MARIEWTGSDGNTLVGDDFGDPDRPPVVLLHGGGQTRHAWGGTAQVLADAGFYAVAIDQRGHGESEWIADGAYGVDRYAADLVAVIERLGRMPAVVGASLGGLAALLAQGESEPITSAVVLVDVAHRLEPDGVLRVIEFMRDRSERGFESLEEVADAIAAYLPHRKRPTDLSGLSKNLRLGEDGRYRWHWDPRFLTPDQRNNPAQMGARLRAAAEHLPVPTLLVRGGLSDVLSDEAAREFQQLAPNAEYVDVSSAAHMIAGDRNDIFTEAVRSFLARAIEPGSR